MREFIEEAQAFFREKLRSNNDDFHSDGRPSKPGPLNVIKKIGIWAVGFVIVYSIALALFSDYGKPWEVMLKQNKFGSNAGFEAEIYPGGCRYMLVPFKQAMYHFDTRLQFLSITTAVTLNDDGTYIIDPNTGVDIPTTDGSTVYSDVTFAFRLYKAPEYNEKKELIHGGPNELRGKAGLSSESWTKLVLQYGDDRCKRALGSLRTDDYYNSRLREEKADLAREYLNNGWKDKDGTYYEGLRQYGIDVVAVLIRAYYYTPLIDKAIASKNIQVQEEKLNKALEKKEVNLALVGKAQGEGDAKIATLKNNREQEAKVILSKGDSYRKIKISDGDYLVGAAEAYAQKLKAQALEVSGSNLYVAKELAPLAKNLQGGVVSGIDPFDMGQWMKRFINTNN